jgi:hypothetical protein
LSIVHLTNAIPYKLESIPINSISKARVYINGSIGFNVIPVLSYRLGTTIKTASLPPFATEATVPTNATPPKQETAVVNSSAIAITFGLIKTVG